MRAKAADRSAGRADLYRSERLIVEAEWQEAGSGRDAMLVTSHIQAGRKAFDHHAVMILPSALPDSRDRSISLFREKLQQAYPDEQFDNAFMGSLG